MSNEKEFENEVICASARCRGLVPPYYPTYYMQMIEDCGAIETARRLVLSGVAQRGFTILMKAGRKDLTIEGIMTKTQFSALFTVEEIKGAHFRLNHWSELPTK